VVEKNIPVNLFITIRLSAGEEDVKGEQVLSKKNYAGYILGTKKSAILLTN